MRRLSRILTAALVAALIVYAGVVTLTAPVLPPEREAGAWYIDGLSPMGFTELVKEADVIARVRIGDWLGVDSHFAVANFEAFPVEVYKGELPEKFVVAQFGNLEYRFYTWFTYGNEVFLFLDIPEDEYDHENTYRLADERTISYISYTDDGDAFIVPYNTDVFKYVPGASTGAYKVIPELRDYLVKNDPELWSDRSVSHVYRLDRVVAVINEVLAANSTEPPALSVSADGETLALEPRGFSWTTQSGEYESPDAAHPLLLSDDEWNDLPYLDGEPSEIEFPCDLEPSHISIVGFHDSYRSVDDPANTNLVERLYIYANEDGIFEIDSSSGYIYVVDVDWYSDPGSETPQFLGSAQYAFRVGETKAIELERITLSSFDAYPTPQLSNTLVGVPRADLLAQFGEPDISQEGYDLWLTDSGKYVRATYHPGDDSVFFIRSSLGLPSTPPILVTIDGVSYPVVTGNASWMYSVDGVVESGLQACHADLQNRDWSADTICTDAREAVITLDLPERIAERISFTIDGAEITAGSAGEAFPLYYGGFTYMFTAFISEKCEEGEEPLFSGKVDCAFRAVVEPK